ncbi:MAG: hypothetical protein ACTSW1_12785 [Candidatus Hodarchaeales archaeon]
MNKNTSPNYFTISFSNKSSWNEFKEDLKTILREYGVKYQYSEKIPTFFILYKGNNLSLKVIWEKNDTLSCRLDRENDDENSVQASKELFDLLQVFGGKLIDGQSPYEKE